MLSLPALSLSKGRSVAFGGPVTNVALRQAQGDEEKSIVCFEWPDS